jgi:hypothetical protein
VGNLVLNVGRKKGAKFPSLSHLRSFAPVPIVCANVLRIHVYE